MSISVLARRAAGSLCDQAGCVISSQLKKELIQGWLGLLSPILTPHCYCLFPRLHLPVYLVRLLRAYLRLYTQVQ